MQLNKLSSTNNTITKNIFFNKFFKKIDELCKEDKRGK